MVIAKLFAIGFVSSAALGSVAGRLCDRRPDLHRLHLPSLVSPCGLVNPSLVPRVCAVEPEAIKGSERGVVASSTALGAKGRH